MLSRPILVVLLGATFAACGGKPPAAVDQPRYRRPDIEKLLESAIVDPSHGIDKETARKAMFSVRGRTASQALWASVVRAEASGIKEMYGVEYVNPFEPSYRALLYVVLESGRTLCLFADQDVHETRQDVGSVPASVVSPEAFQALRRRVSGELPFKVSGNLTTDIHDGSLYLLHGYVGGVSHAALWYEPTPERTLDRDELRLFKECASVNMFVNALWAAAPLELFPSRDESMSERYGAASGIAALLAKR